MRRKTGPALAWRCADLCGINRVTVMAAHAAPAKGNALAHHAQAAKADAMPGGEAALFAQMLAKAGDTDETDAKTGDGATDSENLIAAHIAKLKKSKDAADDVVTNLVDTGVQPAHIAALNAKFASTSPETPVSKTDGAKPVDADATKSAGKNDQTILNRLMEAKTAGTAENPGDAGKKSASQGVVATDATASDATLTPNAMKSAETTAADAKADRTRTDEMRAADAALKNAAAAETATNVQTGTEAAKAAKAGDAKADDTKDAKAQTAVADRAEALAAAADKSVKQTAASQGTQARALPVHLEAQVVASQSGDGSKTGHDAKGSAQTQNQHPKTDPDSQPSDDAVQPATSQAPLNTAGATQPASHAQTQTANVQPPTAQAQAQTAPTVIASVQVAAQSAAQAGAQPNVAALAVQIAAKLDQGTKHFDIRLDPPELGRVEVKLSIDDAGRAQAHLSVEKPQTLDLLQNDRSNLERALKDSGIDLSQNGLNFSLKGQERQGDNSAPFRGRSQALAATAAIESASAANAASTQSVGAGNARLDITV